MQGAILGVESLSKMGYLVLRGYAGKSEMSLWAENLEVIHNNHWSDRQLASKAAPIGIQNSIKDDRIINNLMLYGDVYTNLATEGAHLDVIGALLDDSFYHCIPASDHNFILSQLNARDGRTALPFHVDVRLQIGSKKTWSLQCLLSVDKLTEDNGALRVRPGSHLFDRMPNSRIDYSDSIVIPTDPGDLIIFYSNLHHATCSCNIKKRAWTILMTYRSWWCKQQFDIWGMMQSMGRVKHLTNQQKLLLGACSVPSLDPHSSSSLRVGYEIFG